MRRPDASSVLLAVSVLLVVISTGAGIASTTPPAVGEAADETLVGVQGPGFAGKVARLNETGASTVLASDAASYHDVSTLPNGSILASYAVARQSDCGSYDPPCGRTGVRILHPETGAVEWEWSYRVRSVSDSEVHDAEYLAERAELLVVGMDRERVFTIDMATQQITWQWNASQHYQPPPDPTREDWLHVNDVDRIDEGRYIVSVRNENQLVILNRSCTCVVEVVNEDGAPGLMRGQHNPQWLEAGRVLVADSSNNRVVELAQSEAGGWEIVWARGRAGGQSFSWPRDADRLENGHTLITDSRNHRVVELDSDGELVAEFRTPKMPYEADRTGQEYPAGPPLENDVRPPADGEGGMLLVGGLRIGLHHTVGLPQWVDDIHIAAWWLSLGLALIGVSFRRRED